ncbi:MAG: HNH endonuclease [Candidatus Omnitrophota bacterium]|jgi:putative restriction endonuclease
MATVESMNIKPKNADASQQRGAERHSIEMRYEVLEHFLLDGWTHRELQSKVLRIPAPKHGGGFEAMYILHCFGFGGEDTRGFLKSATSKEKLEDLINSRLSLFSLEQQNAVREAWLRHSWAIEAEEVLREGKTFELGNKEDPVSLAKRRRYQSKLRDIVLDDYGWKCALCDMDHPALLEAGHIKPYRIAEKDKNQPANMLCLCVLHHKLFDLGLISVSPDLLVLVSNELKKSHCSFLSTWLCEKNKLRLPKRYHPLPEHLAFHRKNIFNSD